jgi:hypothetical protein
VAGILVLGALALRLLVTAPAQGELAAQNDAYRRARDARREVQQQLVRAELREARRQKALRLIAGSRGESGDPVTRLRRDAVDSVRDAGVSGVRLSVSPARAPVAATLRLSARGSLVAATDLSLDLTVKRGLILDRVRLTPVDQGVVIDIDGARLLGGS